MGHGPTISGTGAPAVGGSEVMDGATADPRAVRPGRQAGVKIASERRGDGAAVGQEPGHRVGDPLMGTEFMSGRTPSP